MQLSPVEYLRVFQARMNTACLIDSMIPDLMDLAGHRKGEIRHREGT